MNIHEKQILALAKVIKEELAKFDEEEGGRLIEEVRKRDKWHQFCVEEALNLIKKGKV